MMSDLPGNDSDDDTPVKVAYHRAPDTDAPKDEDSDIGIPEVPEEKTPEEDKWQPKTTNIDLPELSDEADPPAPISHNVDDGGYFLQTVRAGEQPEWQTPKEELDVFSQPLEGGLIQYWAYPKSQHKTEDSVPNAEAVAMKNKAVNPVIIIDQVKEHQTPGCCLELILAKGGHALAKADSDLDNLEANISTLIDTARSNFNITAEHFISTANVSPEVEKRLDDLEDAEEEQGDPAPAPAPAFQQASVYNREPTSFPNQPVLPPKSDRSKIAVLIPIVVLLLIGTAVFYRDKILSLVNFSKQEVSVTPAPSPTPTPTPTVSVDRSKYTVRVLNGTPKTGAAGVLAEKLKSLGWQIDKTGNATSSSVAQSYIRGKVNIDEIMKTLLDDVTDYEATLSADILKPSDKADLEFVIGKK